MVRVAILISFLALAVIAVPQAQSPALAEYELLIPGQITDLAIGPDNRLYITGQTMNPAFPVTPNAYDAVCENCRPGTTGRSEGFLLVLTPTGALDYGTFLGGDGSEWKLRVALAADGGVWIAGNNGSGEFAPKRNAGECARFGALFLARLRPGLPYLDDFRCLTGIAVSAVPPPLVPLGGPGGDLAIDPEGDVWLLASAVAGFPTRNAWQPVAAGRVDAFLMEFSPREPLHTYAGYIGGTGSDLAASLAILPDGDIVVAGETDSTDFPAIRAFQRLRSPGSESQTDGFVIRFDPSGRFVKYSTYLGGSRSDGVEGVAGDRDGRVFLTGATTSPDFPVTIGAADPMCGGDQFCFDWDSFLFSLREDGTLGASTFIGGGGGDFGHHVSVLPDGAVVVAGATRSSDFPLVNNRPSTWRPGNVTLPFVTLLDVHATRYERSTLIPAFHQAGTWQAFAADDRFLYTAALKGENPNDSVLRRIATR